MAELKQGIFGIDLGTTYSAVAYIDEAGRSTVAKNAYGDDTTPSVVFFETETNVIVGNVAKESALLSPDSVVSLVKREMGNRDYTRIFFGKEHTPPSISALILQALAKDAETATGRQVSDVVITVPAYFGMLEKEATRQAGELAGLKVVGIVPEPVAAALHYGLGVEAEERTILVYDLGGGTFDVTIIRITDTEIDVLVVGGDDRLGGADWDQVLFDHLVDQLAAQGGDDSIRDDEYAMQEIWILAERTKKELTAAESRSVILRSGGGSAKVPVSRTEFEAMTAHLLDKTIDITRRTLAEAEALHPGVEAEITDVLLVGGSSWMPAVAARINKEFGWDAKLSDPNLAVAKGAALYAAGQTVKEIISRGATAAAVEGGVPAVPITITEDSLTVEQAEEIEDRAGVSLSKVLELGKRQIKNALPKAIGVKLVDDEVPGWQSLNPPPFYIEHLVPAQESLPYTAEVPFVAGTAGANVSRIEVEIWEQAGGVVGRATHENTYLETGAITELDEFRLPVGSPINLFFDVSAEGVVVLKAVEPTSGKACEVRAKIALLDDAQFAAAQGVLAKLTASTS